MTFLHEQLTFLHYLQSMRSPLLNAFFQFLNFFDSDYSAILLVAFVWLGISVKWGRRIGFLLIVDALINFAAKCLLGWPRPCLFDPQLPLVSTSTSFGCPSGGTQMAFVLGCVLIYCWKSKWAWPIGLGYALLIGFSRLFLGVHFPIDVLGGWILGLGVFFLFVNTVEQIERFCFDHARTALFSILALTIGLWSFSYAPTAVKYMKMACMLALGLYLHSMRLKREILRQ